MFSKITSVLMCVALTAFIFSSCQKNGQLPAKTTATANGSINTTAFNTNQALVVIATAGDTIYAVNVCHKGYAADSVAFGTLPDSIGKYLTANYPGYTFKKAYEILNSSKVVQGYVVAIVFNGQPVALAFNASGIFVNVLEEREGRDLNGQGWHEGGMFGDRDGRHRDTIALTALPKSITSYFTANYPTDTLKHAFVNKDSSYLVISMDKGVFATVFSASGTFVKRTQLFPHVVGVTTLLQSALPANVGSYLTTTYPAYVFDSAYTITLNGAIKGYVVIIDANTTKYIVEFDATGAFVKSFTIR